MPPKKKDDKSKVSQPADTVDEEKVATEAELLVSVLKSRLGRYQEAGEKLAVEGFKLADELAKQKLTLQDINEFLTSELKARSVAATQMEERVIELNKQVQEVQKEAQAEVARVRAEAAAQVSAAEGRVRSLTAQLQGGAEFLERREQLEHQLLQLKEQLAARQKEAEQKLSDMERRHLQDKEKMRQEMSAKIKETKITMAQLADQHLESSTKRTLVENEALAAELSYHSAQSSRLAEANSALRDETAELRRQLAVAQKTVESTARKNLLLQQTIKAILKCLQDERPSGAAPANSSTAAGSGQQHLQALTNLSLKDLDIVGESNRDAQQQQQPQEQIAVLDSQQSPLAACEPDLSVAPVEGEHAAAAVDINSKQTQPLTTHAAARVAGDILMQLEHKVIHLADELDAARQALAAAMQGVMPETAAGRVSVTIQGKAAQREPSVGSGIHHSEFRPGSEGSCNSSSIPLRSGPSADVGGVDRGCGSPQGAELQVPMHSSNHSSPPVSGGRSRHRERNRPSTKVQQGPAVWQGGWAGGWTSTGAHTAAQNGPGAASVAAAIEDSVAAFVLYCVQQLRRGNQQSPAAAASNDTPGAAAAAGSVCTGSNKAGHRLCSSPTAKSRQSARAAAAGSIRSMSPSMLGPRPDTHSHSTCAAAAIDSTASADTSSAAAVVDEGVVREHLARLLLDELHGYARHKTAAFQGMQLVMPGQGDSDVAQQQQQQSEVTTQLHQSQIQAQNGSASEAMICSRGHQHGDRCSVAKPSSSAEFDSISQFLLNHPCQQPVLPPPGSGVVVSSSRSSTASPHEHMPVPVNNTALHVLPPLPSLLATIQQQQRQYAHGVDAASPVGRYHAAANEAMSPSSVCKTQAAARCGTEDLFGALLADTWPWSTASHPAGAVNAAAERTCSSIKHRDGRSPSPSRCSPQLSRCGGAVPSPKATRHAAASSAQSSVLR